MLNIATINKEFFISIPDSKVYNAINAVAVERAVPKVFISLLASVADTAVEVREFVAMSLSK